MTVLLLMYLCVDTARTGCQAIPLQQWVGPGAYEQCKDTLAQLTTAFTVELGQLHRFACDKQPDIDIPQPAQSQITRPSFRL